MRAEMSAPATDEPSFERLVVLENPSSTHAGDVGLQLADLQNFWQDRAFVTLQTEQDADATKERLQSTLQRGDVLVIAGGDGTVHQAINVLATKEMAEQKIPILPLHGGNGNDLAHMLNSDLDPLGAQTILKTGRVVPIYPIHGQFVQTDQEVADHIGISYAGFGVTATGAAALNNKLYRKLPGYDKDTVRKFYEGVALAGTILRSPTFTIEEAGRELELFERTIANGSRMAKYGRLPVQLAERQLFIADVRRKPQEIAGWLGSLLARPLIEYPGTYLQADEELAFTTRTPVPVQFDAEPMLLPPNTQVRIRQNPHPIYTLSTDLIST